MDAADETFHLVVDLCASVGTDKLVVSARFWRCFASCGAVQIKADRIGTFHGPHDRIPDEAGIPANILPFRPAQSSGAPPRGRLFIATVSQAITITRRK